MISENKKTVAVLGATGSVGRQALDVARRRGYRVDFIAAGKNVCETERLCREFGVRYAALADPAAASDLRARLSDTDIKVLSGEDGIEEGITNSSAGTVVNAILGEAGLRPTLATIAAGRRLALANKESLVIAGDIVMSRVRETGVGLIPVDSEHSAIFRSLSGHTSRDVRRLILTASGGPFFGRTKDELKSVTLSETLSHPTWKMGKKITVDSATMMNKGFEIIEAAHLFSVPAERIEVVVHRESILHSAVEYIDNTVIGEMSVPDMRSCVQYAIDYPDIEEGVTEELDLFRVGKMTFFPPDTEAFPLLGLAKRAYSLGGAVPAVVNAADEVAVSAFLDGRITFSDISDIVISTAEAMTYARAYTTLADIISSDREARRIAEERVVKIAEAGV